MASLTSGSWTVILRNATGNASNQKTLLIDQTRTSRHKIVNAIWVLTTGESPAGGVPWPDKGQMGFIRNLDAVILQNVRARTAATVGAITASGVHVVATMNATGQKVRFFALGQASGVTQRAWKQLATTVTITGGGRYYVTAMGW